MAEEVGRVATSRSVETVETSHGSLAVATESRQGCSDLVRLGVSQRSLQIREETVENTQQDENGGPLGFFLFLLMYVVGTERVTWPKK